MTGRPSAHLMELTPAQTEVLCRIARGQQQPQIAREMHVSVNTIKSHFRDIFIRLGADNAAHAVALSIGLELIPADVATTSTTAGGSR